MSVLKDVKNKLALVSSLAPAVRTADANGAAIDTQDAIGVGLIAHVGVSGDTLSGSVKAELELEHSDDGSTWADCADEDLGSAVTGTNTGTFAVIDDPAEDDAIYKVNYIGNKRYVRAVLNLTGTHTNGIPVGVVGVLFPQHLPA